MECTVFDSLSDRLSTPSLTPCRLAFLFNHKSSPSHLIDWSVRSTARVTGSRARFAHLVSCLRSGVFGVRLVGEILFVSMSLLICLRLCRQFVKTSRSFSPEAIVYRRLQAFLEVLG